MNTIIDQDKTVRRDSLAFRSEFPSYADQYLKFEMFLPYLIYHSYL